MININYNKSEGIIYIERIGDISAEDIINTIDKIGTTYCHLNHLYVLEDTSQSTAKFSQTDYSSFYEATIKLLEKVNKVSLAMIVAKPDQTALSLLFEEAFKVRNYRIQIFSTELAAKNWLKKKRYNPSIY